MESLRPDSDDLDRFKSRNKKTSGALAPKASTKAVKAERPVRTNNSSVFLLIMILIVVSGFLVWSYMDQRSRIDGLQAELKGASDFIGRSKLLMARFEGELNVTGAEIEQSGSAVQQKLIFLDGEMRKLWGVSNDRNKKDIQKNAKSLTSIIEEIKLIRGQQEKAVELDKASQKAMSNLSSQVGIFHKKTGKLDGRISMLANEAVITRDEQEEALKGMTQELARFKSLLKQLDENKKALASIDASRLQLNERVVSLERKLNKLQLSFKKPTKALDVQ